MSVNWQSHTRNTRNTRPRIEIPLGWLIFWAGVGLGCWIAAIHLLLPVVGR